MYYDCSPSFLKDLNRQGTPGGTTPTESPITSELVVLGSYIGERSSERLDQQLNALIGPVRVIEPHDQSLEDFFEALLATDESDELPPRILFKFRSTPGAPAPQIPSGIVARLALRGFLLIGSDLRRQEWSATAAISSHLAEQGIFFLEGLDLADVPAGDYVLIALPVPLRDTQRCPVRVVLKSVI
jgi:arylformamidase